MGLTLLVAAVIGVIVTAGLVLQEEFRKALGVGVVGVIINTFIYVQWEDSYLLLGILLAAAPGLTAIAPIGWAILRAITIVDHED